MDVLNSCCLCHPEEQEPFLDDNGVSMTSSQKGTQVIRWLVQVSIYVLYM